MVVSTIQSPAGAGHGSGRAFRQVRAPPECILTSGGHSHVPKIIARLRQACWTLRLSTNVWRVPCEDLAPVAQIAFGFALIPASADTKLDKIATKGTSPMWCVAGRQASICSTKTLNARSMLVCTRTDLRTTTSSMGSGEAIYSRVVPAANDEGLHAKMYARRLWCSTSG